MHNIYAYACAHMYEQDTHKKQPVNNVNVSTDLPINLLAAHFSDHH